METSLWFRVSGLGLRLTAHGSGFRDVQIPCKSSGSKAFAILKGPVLVKINYAMIARTNMDISTKHCNLRKNEDKLQDATILIVVTSKRDPLFSGIP